MKDYKIKIGNKLVSVSEKIYREYYKLYRRERYLEETSIKKELSYDYLVDQGYPVEERMLKQQDVVSDVVITKMMIEKMLCSIGELNKFEKDIIKELFYNNISERNLAKKLGLSRSTLQYKKYIILKKLKKLLEK